MNHTTRYGLSGLALGVLLCANLTNQTVFAEPVRVENYITHVALNTDGTEANKGVIESSVTFLANVRLQKIVEHMFDKGVLEKISPEHVKIVKVTKLPENPDTIGYTVEEEITPLPGAPAKLGVTKVTLQFTVDRHALDNEKVLLVKFGLAPGSTSGWSHFSGRIYAVDLHNGSSVIMVTASTKSGMTMLEDLRLKLARQYLDKTKDHIVNWLKALP